MIEETKQTPFLTTIDNVWNPFTHYDEWFAFDLEKQHFSNQVLAKIALVSDALSDEENRQEIERAIDVIVDLDPSREFVKVYKDSFDEDMANARRIYAKWFNSLDSDTKALYDSDFLSLVLDKENKAG